MKLRTPTDMIRHMNPFTAMLLACVASVPFWFLLKWLADRVAVIYESAWYWMGVLLIAFLF